MTIQPSDSNNPVNLIIGISLLVFAGMVAWFVFNIVIGLAPVIGVLIAIAGGIWYLQAETDHQKVRALQMLASGLVITFIFGTIF